MKPLVFLISLSLFLLIGTGQGSFAQPAIEISGNVTDTGNQGLEYVHVICLDDSFLEICGFDVTDPSGKFSIPVPMQVEKYVLCFSSIGYKSDTLIIHKDAVNKAGAIHITLHQSNYQLPEAHVKDLRIPYKINGDTVEYRTDFYTDGTEGSVEELIKKIPGVEVSESGDIYYKGKYVKKVLLENDELFGKRYSIGTRSMAPDVVDRIQFIDHYLENHLHKGIKSSEDLVMNVKLKADRKKLLFGNLEAGTGIPGKYDLSANLFGLYKKSKLFVPGHLNNMGNANFSLANNLQGNLNWEDVYDYQRPAQDVVNIQSHQFTTLKPHQIKLHPSERFYASNLILHPGQAVKIKLYYLSLDEQYQSGHYQLYRDLSYPEERVIEEEDVVDQTGGGKEFKIELQAELSPTSNLFVKSVHQGMNIVQNSDLTGVANYQHYQILQDLNQMNNYHSYSMSFTKKLSANQLLVVNGTKYSDSNWQGYQYQNNPSNGTPFPDQSLEQITHQSISDYDLETNILGSGRFLKYLIGIHYRRQKDDWDMEHFIAPQSNAEITTNHFVYNRTLLSALGSISARIKRTHVSLEFETGRLHTSASTDQSHLRVKAIPWFRNSIRALTTLNSQWKWSVQYAMYKEHAAATDILPTPLYSNYRNVSMGLFEFIYPLNHSWITLLNYSNRNTLMDFTAFVNYSCQSEYYGNRYEYNQLIYAGQKTLLGPKSRFILNLNLDKYIGLLKSNIALSFNFHHASHEVENPESHTVSLESGEIEFDYHSSWESRLNIGLKARYQLSRYTLNSGDLSYSSKNVLMHYYTTYAVKNRLTCKVKLDHIVQSIRGGQNKHYLFPEINLTYKLNEDWRFSIISENLFNHKSFNLESFDLNSYQLDGYDVSRRRIVFYSEYNF